MKLVIGQIFALFLAFDVVAGSFTARVDKTVGTLEDRFVLTLTVNGQADSKPSLPEIDGLDSSSAGTSHSTSWVNGVINREVQYRYLLTANRQGKFTIPSIELVVDGKRYTTLPIVIEVQEQVQRADMPATKDLFLVREFSQETAYVGEQVIETIKLYYRLKLLQANRLDSKKTIDLATFALGEERNYRQVHRGRSYQVTELRQAVVPLRAGQLQVPRFILDVVVGLARRGGGFFDDFFSSRQERRRVVSQPFTLTVKPLPPAPTDVINLEIVGDFSINFSLNDRQLTTGNSATLTLTVAGLGNLQGMKAPQLTKIAGIKVYPDKPQINVEHDRQRGLVARATFKYALLPTSAGNYDLGELRLAYFNPASHEFEISNLNLGTLEVEGDEERVVVAGSQQAVQVIGADLSTIHRGDRLLADHSWTLDKWWQLSAIFVVSLLCYALLFIYLRFFHRRTTRRSRAYRLFREAQQSVSATSANVPAVDRNFRTYLGDKFELRGLAVTSLEMRDKIAIKVTDSELCKRIVDHLQKFDRIVFAGRGDCADIWTKTEQLVKEIEKRC